MHSKIRRVLFCLLLVVPTGAAACPTVSGLINFNCDKIIKITFIGDSIVSGYGDTRNGNRGGYVKRLKKKLPFAKINEDGVPGITTSRMIRTLKSEFRRRRSSRFFRKAYGADLVIIDLARNDYWNENASASGSARNVKRIANIARRKLKKKGIAPFVVIASMLPTNRGFQQAFIDGINRSLFAMHSKRCRVDLEFDTMPNSLLAGDGLHPSSEGYAWLADLIEQYITGRLQNQMEREREDQDGDGVYDLFEKKKFKTDPKVADTDGDGISDGEEIFQLESNPLDPNDPIQDIPVTPTPTVTPVVTASPTPVPTFTTSATPSPTPTP